MINLTENRVKNVRLKIPEELNQEKVSSAFSAGQVQTVTVLWTLRVVSAWGLEPQQQDTTARDTPYFAQSQKPSRTGYCFTKMSKYPKMPGLKPSFEEPGLDP